MEPVHRQILVEAGVDPDQVYVLGGPEGILTHIKRCGRIPQSKDKLLPLLQIWIMYCLPKQNRRGKNKYECRHSNGTYAGEAYSRSGSAGAALLFPSHGLKAACAANFTISSLFLRCRAKRTSIGLCRNAVCDG